MTGTDQKSYLSERETIYILGLHDGGMSPHGIAIKINWNKSTITCMLQRYLWETFNGLATRLNPPRRTTKRDDRMLVRAALTHRTTILADITNSTALNISPHTVQRRRSEHSIRKHIAVSNS